MTSDRNNVQPFGDLVPEYLCEGYGFLMEGNTEPAIRLWEELFARYPSAEVCGYLARAHYFEFHFLGANGSDPKCAEHLEHANRWAERALQLNPNSSTGHTMLAIAIGHSVKAKLRLQNVEATVQIRRHLEQAITIDNSWAAHLMLGIWHRRVSALATHHQFLVKMFLQSRETPSFDTSIMHFNEVLSQLPDNTIALAELAYTYKLMNNLQRANELAEQCMRMPPFKHPLGKLWTARTLGLMGYAYTGEETKQPK